MAGWILAVSVIVSLALFSNAMIARNWQLSSKVSELEERVEFQKTKLQERAVEIEERDDRIEELDKAISEFRESIENIQFKRDIAFVKASIAEDNQ